MLKRQRRSDARRREGFTLLEVVVAFSMFGVGMLSLTAMQLHAIRAGSSGRHASQAATIAQTRMEQLQRLRWTNAALAPNNTWSAPFTVNNTVQSSPNQVEQVYTRARELCQQLGDTPQIFPVLFGLFRFYIVQPQLQIAREISETLLSLAQRDQDPSLHVIAHYALGYTQLILGEYSDTGHGRTGTPARPATMS